MADPLDPDQIIYTRLRTSGYSLSVNSVPAIEKLPFVVIAQFDGETEMDLDGGGHGSGSMEEASVAVECSAMSLSQAKQMAKACRLLLDGEEWEILDEHGAVVGWVQGAFVDGVDDDYQPRSKDDHETIETVSFTVELFIGAA